MEIDGFASFWIGKGGNRKAFGKLLEYRITEDGLGDFEACAFCRAIGIKSYDPDFLEGRFWAKDIHRLSILFHSFSYTDIILPQLGALEVEIQPSNCCVGLYCYKFEGDQKDFEIGDFSFSFLGCAEYKPLAPMNTPLQ